MTCECGCGAHDPKYCRTTIEAGVRARYHEQTTRGGVLALSPAAWRLGCTGCHDRSWNGHPNAPRNTQPMRCPTCPVNKLLPRLDPKKVSRYGGGYRHALEIWERAHNIEREAA